MEEYPTKEKHHGKEVWVNPTTESIRKEECLCFNCNLLKPDQQDNCFIAKLLYEACAQNDIALMVTRCPLWESELTKLLNAYLANNPEGEEKITFIFNVSHLTIAEWTKGKTSPCRNTARMLISFLKDELRAG